MSRLCSDSDLPVSCSVCLQPPATHDPKIKYVNFESAYDGPVIKDEDNPTVPGVYVEKIVICEICVREAARLLNLVEGDASKVAAWKGYAESLEDDMVAKDRAISNLSHTVGVLLDHPAKRPMGRPQIQGPDSHEETLKEMRKPKKAKAASASRS